jgi:Helicase HerA, central domain
VTLHSAARVLYRYLAGRPLDGQPGTPYLADPFHPLAAWGRLPGWQRQAWRLAAPAAAGAGCAGWLTHPGPTAAVAAAAGAVATVRVGRAARQAWAMRRFRRAYIRPTLAALRPALGDAPVRLHVDPGLGQLVPRLARAMSPAETAARTWYGQRLEPVLRWAPDRAQRAAWAAQRVLAPPARPFRRPPPEGQGPRIELTASVPYLTPEQRNYVSSVVAAKIPAGELVEAWDQVGPRVTATWTVRRRPPTRCGYADLDARLGNLAEWEFFLGLGVGSAPVVVSLRDDSPHIALSAGSGAGKSVLAQLVAVQVLARGGQVVILDRKGSHRWALGQPGVDYCTRPEQMSAALVRLAKLADQRNAAALHEDEDWDPGYRVLVIAEELNATFAQLRAWWEDTREKGQPKIPPAVRAFRELLFMGRSAKINVLAVAQLLTAQTTGGPETRENFGVRCLARYTRNAWQMLVPEAAMPRSSRTLGRWQVVVGGVATEAQVCYLSAAEARLIISKYRSVPDVPDVPGSAGTPLMASNQEMFPEHGSLGDIQDPLSELLTLRQAVDRGLAPWKFDATKRRLQRAGRRPGAPVPEPAGRQGLAHLYRLGDLIAWVESELVG